jgi:glycine cleavage system H lipoate-binding protein
MVVIDKFLGQRVTIPEDRRYHLKQGLWGQLHDRTIRFGLSQPKIVLSGGLKDLDWIVDSGSTVSAGDTIIFAITEKFLYLDAPISGIIHFNKALREDPSRITAHPYGREWIFQIDPSDNIHIAYDTLSSAEDYRSKLRETEGFKNPEGIKGGVSGICKAVYTGINQQKI